MDVGVSLALRLISPESIELLWASGHRSTGSVFLNQCDVTVGWVGCESRKQVLLGGSRNLVSGLMGIMLLMKLPLRLQVQELSITGLRAGNIPLLPTGIPGLSTTDVPDNNRSGDSIPNKHSFRGFEVSPRWL
jgi:hypothetical protein